MSRTVLLARLDNDGDVLLSGPAVRAVAAHATRVLYLCGPRGRQAARLLPGVDEVLTWHCPWIDAEPGPVSRGEIDRLVDDLQTRGIDEAVVFTSYHQSPLPLVLLLRMAGIARVTADSEYYPGSLLDVRHRLPVTGLHEVERMLSVTAAAGFGLPPGDDAALAVRVPGPGPQPLVGAEPYVVVHPGASVPARSWSPRRWRELVHALAERATRVVVTGGPAETALTAIVAGGRALDLGGGTDLAALAGVLARADAVVVGNTGPAHLAAAVDTPVVSLFAPTVPAERWRPWRVPSRLLGRQDIYCAGCRARVCPVAGHPCLDTVPVTAVVQALDELQRRTGAPGRAPAPGPDLVEVGG